jgi:hypothetical protein
MILPNWLTIFVFTCLKEHRTGEQRGAGVGGLQSRGRGTLFGPLVVDPNYAAGRLSNNPGNEVIRRREPYNFSGLKLLANGVKR